VVRATDHKQGSSQWFFKFIGKSNRKGKVHPITVHEGPEVELRYSFTLSLTSALDGWMFKATPRPILPPGKSRYPLYGRLGGPHGRSGWVLKISPPTVFDPRTVPVVSRYTGWVIPDLKFINKLNFWSVSGLDKSFTRTSPSEFEFLIHLTLGGGGGISR
jgi:hypothetical protein